ncbi:MAG TPA: YbjN domain-containing protein [Acidimicrobiales bacterium]|nr:YbjN domain-containing protein [Acidimicrobiales bacterium]
MSIEPAGPDELARLAQLIGAWGDDQLRDNPSLLGIEPATDAPRWYVRLQGEEKGVFTVWLTLRQRTLHVETYFMPAPEEREAELYEYLLRLNERLYGLSFAIGLEDAVYLVGHVPVSELDTAQLDQVIGAAYAYTEQYFRPAMRIGYASKFKG